MLRRLLLALCALAATSLSGCGAPAGHPGATGPAQPALPASSPAAAAFNALAERYYDDHLALDPLLATVRGEHRYDARFGDYASIGWVADSLAVEQDALQALAQVDPRALTASERLEYDAFKRQRERNAEGFRYPSELLPAGQVERLPLEFAWLGSGQGPQPFRSAADYDAFLARMDGFVRWVDQTIDELRSGVARGVVEPRTVVERWLPPLAALGVQDPKASVFWGPILNFPAGLSVADRRRLIDAYRERLGGRVLPAYRRLHDYLQRDYLPRARASGGMSSQPNGDAWYAYLVRYHTDSTLTPVDVHQLGLREVARIRSDIARVGGGDPRAVFDGLRADPEAAPATAADVLAEYAAVRDSVAPGLARVVQDRAPAALDLRLVEAYRAPFAPAVEYRPPSTDGRRKAVLYVNAGTLTAQPRYLVQARFMAEALPGRHLQASVAQSQARLPRVLRYADGDRALRDGWSVYALGLGAELGLASGVREQLGVLQLQALAAARLVVDTGVNAMRWTRPQAIEYLRANAGLDDAAAAEEVDACLAHPGAALGGGVGAQRLRELQRRAAQKLGTRFDLRAFHSQVLDAGAVPLTVLEAGIDRWIAVQSK